MDSPLITSSQNQVVVRSGRLAFFGSFVRVRKHGTMGTKSFFEVKSFFFALQTHYGRMMTKFVLRAAKQLCIKTFVSV